MKRLNIFVDESGSITPLGKEIDKKVFFSDKYYIVSLIFAYDNDEHIQNTISRMKKLKDILKTVEPIHYGPLIRRDNDYYKQFTKEEVWKAFVETSYIISSSPIRYMTIVLDKSKISSVKEFEDYFINNFENAYYGSSFFKEINDIKVYYDGGQACVVKFIKQGLYKCFPKYEDVLFNKKPNDYVLLQLADFICTIKLIDMKRNNNCSLNCEKRVFDNPKKYKKYIKDKIIKKKI